MKTKIKELVRIVLMLTGIGLANGAWAAAKPVAIWHGDFATGAAGARGGYVINANGNTVNTSSITIDGSKGVIVTNTSVTANLEDYPLGVVARFTGAVYSSSTRALATTITSATSAGSDRTWFGVNNSTQMQSYYNNSGLPAAWTGERKNYDANHAWPNTGTHYFGCTYSAEDKDGSSGRFGWRSYVDGVLSVWNNGMFSYNTDRYLYGYGFAIGGSTTGDQFTDATIDYIAIVRSAYPSDIAYWSLTDMTKTAATFAGSDANTGVNVPASGETISAATAAAAVFVQADATLGFSGSGSLTIGDGTGPLYIDSAATLTIDLNGVTAPTAESPFVLLVKGQVYGAAQVNFINVPSDIITSIGEGGTIALLHNSVYTDLLASWKSNGQKVFAWRTAGSSSFFSSTAKLVDTDTGVIGASTTISAYNDNGGFHDENPAGVLYYDDPAYLSSATVDYAYFTLGGLFVTAGGSSLSHSDQELKLGDNSSNRKTFNYVFAQSFTLGPFNKNKLYGPVNLTIYEGATLTLSPNGLTLAPNSGYDAGKQAHLMMSGGGVVKTSGTITATGADVTLDYSALDVSRTEPFIQGNLTIDNNTKLVLPGALAADTPYKLCSGTLAVGSTSLQKSITVGSNTFLADLTFDTSAKTVSYCPARTTTVSGGTTEWSSLTWANGTGTAGWASGANAHINVSAASTISVGSATTVNKLKLLGSADLTITGVGNLTVGSFDLSGYTGNLIVDGGLPAAVTLCGGNLVFDIAGSTDISGSRNYADAFQTCSISGTGNVYKRGVGSFYFGRTSDATVVENSYTGSTYVENGIARRWGAKAFGATGNTVYVGSNASSTATVDLVSAWDGSANYNYHIAGTGFGRYPAMTQRDSSSSGGSSVGSLSLDDDATIGVDSGKEIRMGSYGGNWYLKLNSHTLKKVGLGTLMIDDCYFYTDETAVGIIEVAEGTFRPSCYDFKNLSLKLIVRENATCRTAFWYQSANRFVINEVENYGTISVDGNDDGGRSNLLYVKTSYTGNGTANRLYLKDGVTLKPTSATTRMTVSGALTLEGKINVDLSGIDLTGRYDLPIIAGPTQIDKDNDVDTFNRGYNSANWGLYSELVSEGTYVLGVRLSTITDPVSWNGAGGTWSVNSFDGGTENYSNQALQTVTFADNGESTDPIAVAVSGAKTVNALNFTADNRNVTLSGDAISATTVSKSGDGVAIVNNALSGITSISVTDGVLVLNPNGEAVANVDGLEAGTLVIYVGSGETRTVTESSISAAKIVKRGQGTLDLTAVSPSVPIVIDDGKVDVDEIPSASVTINTAGTLELKCDTDSNDADTADLSQIGGTGTVIISTASGWHTYPNADARMLPTTLTLKDEVANALIITKPNGETAIGSLTGSKNIRSDWKDNGSDGRILKVVQSKDTEWQGSFQNNRLTEFKVAGSGNGGTLKLSATFDSTITVPLTVESTGSVNLTGTYYGAATVAGTFGGTGNITGALTFNEGSTFKVWATGGLSVTGGITFPATSLTVDVSDLTIGREDRTVLLTATSGSNFPAVGNFTLTGSSTHVLSKTGQKEWSLLPIIATYSRNDGSGIVTPYVDSVDVAINALVTQKATYPNAYVTVFIGAPSYYTAELLASNGIALDAETGNYVIAEAKIDDTLYPTIEAAIANAGEDDTVVLAKDISRTEIAVNKEVEFSEGDCTFTGSFTGTGTLTLTKLWKSSSTDRLAAAWDGTVVLPVITTGGIYLNHYGKSGTVVKITSFAKDSESEESGPWLPNEAVQPTIELVGNMTLEHFSMSFANTINVLTGSGTITLSNNPETFTPGDNSPYFCIGDVAGFTGSIVASGKPDIVIGTTTKPSDKNARGTILVQSGSTVAISSTTTWTASTIKIDGAVTVASGGALSGSIAGSGTITYETTFPKSQMAFGEWTGIVELPSFWAGGEDLNHYGKANSKVKLNGITGGYLTPAHDGYEKYTFAPDLVLAGNLQLTQFSSRAWTFATISGSGNFNLSTEGTKLKSVTIGGIAANYTGIVTNGMSDMTMSITSLALPAGKSVTTGAKILSTGGSGTISVGSVTLGGNSISPSLSYQSDGVYIAIDPGAGYMSDATTAVVTNTTSLITLSSATTDLKLYPQTSGDIAITGATGLTGYNIYVRYADANDDVQEQNVNYLYLLAGAAGNYVLTLNPAGTAKVNSETINLQPEIRTGVGDPMSMADDAAAFTVKTIPGLYYAVQSGTFDGSGNWVPDTGSGSVGSATQATSASTTVSAPDFDDSATVKYYKISVGLTADEARQ